MYIARTDQSIFGQWWWTVDRLALGLVIALMCLGVVLIMAASPPVAQRIGLGQYYFVIHHLILLVPSFMLMIAVSFASLRDLRRISFLMFVVSFALVVGTLFFGMEIKGAKRWLHLPGFSLQPSELLKPAFVVVTAWLLACQKTMPGFPGNKIAIGLFLACVGVLLLQPDLGMSFVLSLVWFAQFFLAGMPILWVVILAGVGIVGLFGAYMFLPHVTSRIDRFLDADKGDHYQIERSMDAFQNGGIFGIGPGQGSVKMYLPDAHADFVFSVAGEEFGLIWCLILVAIFMIFIVRGLRRVAREDNLFVMLAVSGLLIEFGLQTLINMGSTLHLIPTKGMTLPFLSYGGSSLIAYSFAIGIVLGLTRRNVGS